MFVDYDRLTMHEDPFGGVVVSLVVLFFYYFCGEVFSFVVFLYPLQIVGDSSSFFLVRICYYFNVNYDRSVLSTPLPCVGRIAY